MDGHQVIAVIVSEAPAVSAVPNGRKQNVFFLVDNTVSIGNRTASQYSKFADDCGIWDAQKSSTKKHDFIMTKEGQVQFVKKHAALYYT